MRERERYEAGRGTRFLLALFVAMPLAIGLAVAIVSRFVPPLYSCVNEIRAEIPSPSGEHRAVVFRRNCGATTAFSTHVSVVPSSETLPDQGGNLLVLDGEPDVEATWTRPEHLEVSYPRSSEVFYASGEARGVTATHTPRDSE